MTAGPISGLQHTAEDGVPGARLRLQLATALGPAPGVHDLPARESVATAVRPWRRPRRAAWQQRPLAIGDAVWAAVALAATSTLLPGLRSDALFAAAAVLAAVIGKLVGTYERDPVRLQGSTLDEAPSLAIVAGLLTLVLTILAPTLTAHGLGGERLGAIWLALFAALILSRVTTRFLIARIFAVERCVVLGDPVQAERLHDRLAHSHARSQIVAAVPLTGEDLAELTTISLASWICEIVQEMEVDRLVLAPTGRMIERLADLIRVARAAGVGVSILPGGLDCIGSVVAIEEINGLALMGMRPIGLSRAATTFKRILDLAAAGTGLVVLSPILGIIAAAIRLDSAGPVFFLQTRVGRDGEHFQIVKFRSMILDAESRQDELRELSEVGHGMFKLTDDPRVTRVGRLIRRASLDELPQLLNVLRGEMSLVGPRPLVVDEDAAIEGLDRDRLHLTPGMTGPWQVLRKRVPQREMIELDYRYAANWSPWLDLKLLAMTVRHVIRRGNL